MLLSIIIASRNGARTIGYALRALQLQTESDFETIVVDDGSTDGTGDEARLFPNVIVVRNDESRGVSACRNAGAKIASSRWLCFLDDDDWYPPLFVKHALSLLESGVALCYDNVIVVAEAGEEDRGVVLESIFTASKHKQSEYDFESLHHCFDELPLLKSIVERDAFERVNGFDSRYIVGEDYHFHIKLLANGHRLRLVREPHAIYRRRTDSVMARAYGKGIHLRIAAADRWVTMATDMLAELHLSPLARIALRRDLLDPWRYRLIIAIVRSVASGDRSPLRLERMRHVRGALKHGMTVHWPNVVGASFARLQGRLGMTVRP